MSNNIAAAFSPTFGVVPNRWASSWNPFRGTAIRLFLRRSSSRAAALLRLAATTVGRSDTALGAFYRRLSSRAGKSKAVTATARKIAVLFYNTLRHGISYRDPGAHLFFLKFRRPLLATLFPYTTLLPFGVVPNRWASSWNPFRGTAIRLFLRKSIA